MAKDYVGDEAVRPLEKLILDFARPRGYDIDKTFTALLDYIIWQLDPTGGEIDYWPFKEGEYIAFADMTRCLIEILNREIPKRGWYDAFGDLFMSLHRAGNSKGQFFTPPSLCNMMAQTMLTHQEPEEYQSWRFGRRLTMNDCACGSSRLLLAGGVEQIKVMREEWGLDPVIAYARRPYLIAEDLDYNCVKMSAINIALHGFFGECVCHDTLCEPGEVRLGYIINESMWPIPCDYPSIRKEMRPEAFHTTRLWHLRQQQLKEQDNGRRDSKNHPTDSDHRGDAERTARQYDGVGGTEQSEVQLQQPHQAPEAATARRGTERQEPKQLTLW